MSAGAAPSGTARGSHLLLASPYRWRHFQTPAATPLPEPQAPVSRPVFQNWGEEGGPRRAIPASGQLSGGEDSGSPRMCEGVDPCSLCTRCRLGWALGEKLPLASRPLQTLLLRPGMPFLLSQHHRHPLLAQGSQVPCMGVPVCGGQPGMGRYSVGRSVSQCMKATSAGLEQGPGGPGSLHRPTWEPEAGRGRGLRTVPARTSPSGEAPLQSAYTQLFLFTANPLQKVWPSVLPRSASGCQPPAGHTHSLWTPIS